MFDIHSHILPGLDDGASDISVSIEMARSYLDQGVLGVVCTPHIMPGVYNNSGRTILAAVASLTDRLREEGLPLALFPGADNHMAADFVSGLRAGRLLSLAGTRYVLVEPPDHVAPVQIELFLFDLQTAGYIPVLTHPERLRWIAQKYAMIQALSQRGVWLQVTSGSLIGTFGRTPKYWAERMIADGIVNVIASDAHNMGRRPPDLAQGLRLAERLVGSREAGHLFVTRPKGIILGVPLAGMPPTPNRSMNESEQDSSKGGEAVARSAFHRLIGRMRRLLAK